MAGPRWVVAAARCVQVPCGAGGGGAMCCGGPLPPGEDASQAAVQREHVANMPSASRASWRSVGARARGGQLQNALRRVCLQRGALVGREIARKGGEGYGYLHPHPPPCWGPASSRGVDSCQRPMVWEHGVSPPFQRVGKLDGRNGTLWRSGTQTCRHEPAVNHLGAIYGRPNRRSWPHTPLVHIHRIHRNHRTLDKNLCAGRENASRRKYNRGCQQGRARHASQLIMQSRCVGS